MVEKFKTLSSDTLYKNPYWEYKYDKYNMPSGRAGEYFYVETPGSVMVIPLLDNGRIILVKQYRYLNKRFSFEFPGGGIKTTDGELVSAKNELLEESGYMSDSLTKIGIFNPFNGVTNEICNVYIADNLKFAESVPDESEEFDTISYSIKEIDNMIATNKIWDGMTLSAWSLFRFSNYKEKYLCP